MTAGLTGCLPDDMSDNMKKGKWQIQLKLERVPRASAAAMLASSLCAFVITGIPGANMESRLILGAMLLCAVFTAFIELAALPDAVLLGSCAGFASVGGVLFFAPFENKSIYTALIEGADISTSRVLTMVLFLCGALCLVVCVLNRSFIMRCIAAGGLLAMLIVFIWLGLNLLTVPAILITAYILIVLCQICASRISPTADSPREMWFILFGLITAVIVFSLPYPSTRIQWEKLFEIRAGEQLEQIGETLGIEQLEDDPEIAESGYSENQSSLGGWLELVSDVQLQVEFSDNVHSDRLTGGMYDRYTGTGWVCSSEFAGTGYAAVPDDFPAELMPGENADLYGSAVISAIHKNPESEANRSSLFYPPYSHSVLSSGSREAAVRDGMRLIFEQKDSQIYEAVYYKQPVEYELTELERASCLQLYDGLPERVRELALEAVEGCEDDESKAYELMCIFDGYKYETQVSSVPQGRDFVDYFLFDSKEGYCAYFASAMTVMARCVGIPARYVQGYYIGSDDVLTVTVTSGSAHAWAELYIDGRWVIYDPAISPMQEMTEGAVAAPDEPVSGQDNSALNKILMYAYIVLAAAAVIFFVFRPFFRRIPWNIKLKRKHGRNRGYKNIARCGKLMWVLAACSVKREESETLTEFGGRVREECEWLDEAAGQKASRLFELTSRALYDPDSTAEYTKENAARAVRKAYIRKFGLLKYLRGLRRASV